MINTDRSLSRPTRVRRPDVPLLILLATVAVPLLGAGGYVLYLEMAFSMKATLTLCIAAVAIPMIGLMAYIVANPSESPDD